MKISSNFYTDWGSGRSSQRVSTACGEDLPVCLANTEVLHAHVSCEAFFPELSSFKLFKPRELALSRLHRTMVRTKLESYSWVGERKKEGKERH